MLLNKKFFAAFAAAVALVITGCEIPSTITITGSGTVTGSGAVTGSGSNASSVSCSAVVSNSLVQNGVAFPVAISAQGGTAPYSVVGSNISFSLVGSVTETNTNTTSTNQVVTDSFTVVDSLNNSAVCTLNVTVQPTASNSSPSNIACTLQAIPSFVHVNTPVNFLVTGSGSYAPFTFSAFVPGANGSSVGLSQLSTTQATAVASYSTPGLSTASVVVTDEDGNTGSCSQTITVNAAPSVSVAESAASVAANAAITLTASTSGFFGTPTYVFNESDVSGNVLATESGVTISASANVAVVTVSDAKTHDFYMKVAANSVTATNQDSAFRTIHLHFTTTMPLSCAVTPDAAVHNVGDVVTYTANSTDGEALSLTQFTTNGKIVGQPTAASIQVQYDFAGTENVSALAVSTASGIACNAGSILQSSVKINSNLSCSVTLSAYTVASGTIVNATLLVPGTYEAGAVQIVAVSASGTGNGSVSVVGWNSGLSPELLFSGQASLTLSVTVEDNAGATSTCSTMVTVH
jgi:hypothetical protein